MSELIIRPELVRVYIDDILCITNAQISAAETEANAWKKYLAQLEKVLEKIQNSGLKVNTKKSLFGRQTLK